MGAHIVNGQFQSDKYPTCPPGKVPLSVKDPTAQDLLWEYAARRESVDTEFSADLRTALMTAGYRNTSARRFIWTDPNTGKQIEGCYFECSDLVVYAGGQRGTGKPTGIVAWVDG